MTSKKTSVRELTGNEYDEQCPMCRNTIHTLLGKLGSLTMVRCRACGCDYSIDVGDDDEPERLPLQPVENYIQARGIDDEEE